MRKQQIPFFVLALLLSLVPAQRAVAADQVPSCAANAAAHQLDYWLGEWSVSSPGMAGKGHSSVHSALDQCLVIESWGSDTSNHRGENYLAYSADEKAWIGLFADNEGRVHPLRGTVASGEAALLGPGYDESGAPVLKRVKVVRVNPDTVEQIWQKSEDHGLSWTTDFKMEYVRRKP
jgi:hypothetical protein